MPSTKSSCKIALIGDVHTFWDEHDSAYFNSSDYDLILFVGDLPGRFHRETLQVARRIAELTKPALLIPGNHDGTSIPQLFGELFQKQFLIRTFSGAQQRRCRKLAAALGSVRLCGYSRHHFRFGENEFEVIAARPHSMGGHFLGFAPYLQKEFGVANLRDSVRLLKNLIDESTTNRLIFLSHNGPSGLGRAHDDIWGCDFNKNGGDFGDYDFRSALTYARQKGKNVLAALGGHMHHNLKTGGTRKWVSRKHGSVFVNAARVPRIFMQNGKTVRHHIALTLVDGQVQVAEQVL